MYIPEIGDQLILTKDWTFNLHCERRNENLAKYFGYCMNRSLWVSIEDLPPWDLPYPEDAIESKIWNKAYDEWALKASKIEHKSELLVTIPANTILSIDRIYIRKGAKDYSSITFYAKNLGKIETMSRWTGKKLNKKALRFWAKLSDCNNIEFQKI